MVRYLQHHVNEDGGWGLHLEGKSTVFATGLYYVMLRLIGMDRHDPLTSKARECLLSLGGVAGIPQWGKTWLACLNLYDWEGVNCIPADLYKINFAKHCNTIAPSDVVRSVSPLLSFCFSILTIFYNYLMPRWLLNLASCRTSELMLIEERNTDWERLAPVNKAFHMVQAWFEEGPDSERLRLHREKINVYLWMDTSGMTCNGTNGVQVWDTAFTVQAAVEAGFADDPMSFPQYPRKGGWPFSTKSNEYIVSDCAAESLKAVLLLQKGHGYPPLIDDYRPKDCVDTLLLMRNADGGFASYEKIRGSEWLELLNPAEVFDRIMVEYSYPECTTAVLTTDKFTRLSDQVYLLSAPQNSLDKDIADEHGPDLVLLFGWGDASLKHVAKFADGFRIMFPKAKIILVLAPIFKGLFSSQYERISCVQPLIHEAFGTESAAHTPGQDPSVLVHVLSSTGCLYFTATLEAYRNAFGQVMPHSLLVMDSTPGSIDHSPSKIGRMADAMAVDARSKVPWPPQVTKVMCIMLLYMLRALELARSRENLLVVAFRMANDEIFETKLARRLYIYSKEDRTTAWEAVEKHADEARHLGYQVESSLWEGSVHVEHMRKSPKKYWSIISKVWGEATGSLVVKARL
ncbi:hypothetical protein CGLO_11078 [Colletotrichum gloeosporioides Cg-14]|uniref:Squalene cyclase N-terminal domain-containing protein n=1 Tax=Colletotrichum gloeosporioides (strain Cg-14) TaxID=1237896 RepID=T0LMU9_COLGC|nr:hypothetical protein CGLO_11078 [Colletotrichum gloeosporioides Cg-14]